MNIYWRPFHEVVPGNRPGQDFVAYDEGHEKSIGRVCLEHHSAYRGRWRLFPTIGTTVGDTA